MSDVLTIYFDNLDIDNVCFPGQEIKGRVECKLNEPKQTKGTCFNESKQFKHRLFL